MIYVTGDTHGDETRLSKQELKMLKPGDTLIICGDFGFVWDNSAREKKTLARLAKRGYTVCFVDGTHENFELLSSYPLVKWHGGKAHKLADNIFHLMRGQVFDIGGKKVFALGGGENPDLELKEDEEITSRPEVPTKQEMLEGVASLEKQAYRVDYIVTHEPPARIRDFLNMNADKQASGVTALGAYLDELNQQTEYTRWFFGSMHTDKFISEKTVSLFSAVVDAQTGRKVN